MNEDYLKEKRILIVDDEPELLEMVVSFLQEEGFKQIDTANTVKKAVEVVQKTAPDLAILDVMLPDGDGFSLMKELKQTTDFATIFLTARGEDTDRLTGLGLGADDYLVKPFLPKELVFRVLAILRRTYKEEPTLVQLKNCQIDFARAEIIKEEKTLFLTAKEHALLKALYHNAGRIVTIDALCEAAWGENPFGYENTLMAHIRRIRQKIEKQPSNPVSLITVKGLGYKLIVEDS
ncbi:response regulator transcription factor [Tetragenococcus solitarius]|uniref:Response regulator transcription factor n=1 Tax=Tetragenococcus solitarius TaxID=71453 RepID=A0ABN3YA13_9ENTE|nr:response regulator transcription factor [Tetragenococcus solitarius]